MSRPRRLASRWRSPRVSVRPATPHVARLPPERSTGPVAWRSPGRAPYRGVTGKDPGRRLHHLRAAPARHLLSRRPLVPWVWKLAPHDQRSNLESTCRTAFAAQSGELALISRLFTVSSRRRARSADIVFGRAAAPFGPRRNHVTSLFCRRAVHRSGNAEGSGGIHATRFGFEGRRDDPRSRRRAMCSECSPLGSQSMKCEVSTHLATTPRGECRATLHGKWAGN